MTAFQRLALIAFICLEVLIFVGAGVRASGSGLGCPDWPFCYGCWVPPTSADRIDFTKLDLEKFKAKAEQHGRDPSLITAETLKAEFDPVATWIEYLNRLTSLPVGLSATALLLTSFWQRHWGVRAGGVAAVLLVGINAWLGAKVVFSGLKPGIITLHMALAILLLCVLVYVAWRGTERPWRLGLTRGMPFTMALVLFVLVIAEGILGSQVREMTDHLAKIHQGEQRWQWVAELEQTWVYLVHRSFSWFVLGAAIAYGMAVKRALGHVGWLEKSIIALVLAQMVLGIVLAHVGIVRTAQVLHIGLSSLLVSALFLWLLGGRPTSATVDSDSDD